ncbi:MAG: hypothetical protein MJ058_00275 [Akkermansia sp.]|nr:hypothetical protein [Akkermansia sp.]
MSIPNKFRPVCGLAAVELADELVYGPDKFLDFTELLPVTGVEVVLSRFAAGTSIANVNIVYVFTLTMGGGSILITKYSLPSGNSSRNYIGFPWSSARWLGTGNRGERLPETFSVTVENGLWTVTNPYGDVAAEQEPAPMAQTRLRVGRCVYSEPSPTPSWQIGIAGVTLARDGVRYEFLPRADQTGVYCAALKKNIRLSTI